ncbi:hypothetical protein EV281_11452 [Rhizobium sp. BK418]|nr:hypothetical protein EV281_11452 [Rhizobium sp. BK418]
MANSETRDVSILGLRNAHAAKSHPLSIINSRLQGFETIRKSQPISISMSRKPKARSVAWGNPENERHEHAGNGGKGW